MMIFLMVFVFIISMMIIAGIFLSKLAEISKSDKGKYTWLWGAIIIIAILVIPLLILGIIVILMLYPELVGSFKTLFGQE